MSVTNTNSKEFSELEIAHYKAALDTEPNLLRKLREKLLFVGFLEVPMDVTLERLDSAVSDGLTEINVSEYDPDCGCEYSMYGISLYDMEKYYKLHSYDFRKQVSLKRLNGLVNTLNTAIDRLDNPYHTKHSDFREAVYKGMAVKTEEVKTAQKIKIPKDSRSLSILNFRRKLTALKKQGYNVIYPEDDHVSVKCISKTIRSKEEIEFMYIDHLEKDVEMARKWIRKEVVLFQADPDFELFKKYV